MPCGKGRAPVPCPAAQRTWPASRRRPARWFSFAVFLFLFGAALFQKLLHDGFFARLLLEDAAKRINVFAGDGLEDDALTLLHEVDAGAGLDAETAPDARGDDQLAFGCDVGGVHIVSVILKKNGTNTNVRQ